MSEKSIELLKECAEIFDKMDEVCWRDDSIWNENCYGIVSQKVSNFLNDLEKLAPCHVCKKPRGEEENGAYVCPCPHCGDEAPF